MSPFFAIWTQPRQTIRTVIDTDVTFRVIPLAMVAGVLNSLDNATGRGGYVEELGLPAVFIMALAIGTLGGVFALYVSGALLKWGGGILGGRAEADEVRAAIAWSSSVRTVGIITAAAIQLPFMGREFFTLNTPILDARLASDPVYAIWFGVMFIVVATVATILGIWYVVVFLKCLGEAHQFSAWRALLAVIIGYGVIIVPLIALALLSTRFI